MRTACCGDIKRCVMVVSYRSFGTNNRSHLHVSSSPRRLHEPSRWKQYGVQKLRQETTILRCIKLQTNSADYVDGRSASSRDNKKFRTRSMEKQRGKALGFRKTATAVKETGQTDSWRRFHYALFSSNKFMYLFISTFCDKVPVKT